MEDDRRVKKESESLSSSSDEELDVEQSQPLDCSSSTNGSMSPPANSQSVKKISTATKPATAPKPSSHREFFAKLYGSIEEENKAKEEKQKSKSLEIPQFIPHHPLLLQQQHPQQHFWPHPPPQPPTTSSSSSSTSIEENPQPLMNAFRFGEFPFPGGLAAFRKYKPVFCKHYKWFSYANLRHHKDSKREISLDKHFS